MSYERQGLQAAAGEADVLIVWGVGNLAQVIPDVAIPVVLVSHGISPTTIRSSEAAATHYVAVSESDRRRYSPAVRPSVTILHNGIDTQRCTPTVSRQRMRAEWGFDDQARLIGYVGRYAPEKNPAAAGHAAQALGGDHYAIYIGQGPMEAALRSELQPGGPVRFLPVDRQVGNVLCALDVLLLASPAEGFSLSVAEAWYCQVPVVATRVGAIPELERLHGQLVSPIPVDPTPGQLADAVKRALSPAFRNEVIPRAQEMVCRHYTANDMVQRWVKYLYSIVPVRPNVRPKDQQGPAGDAGAPRVRVAAAASAGDVVERCEAMIKSFRRFGPLLRLVTSLRRFYPGMQVLIADDSFEGNPGDPEIAPEVTELKRMEGVRWFQLPFDVGLSYGRNQLVGHGTKPFALNLDDDFVITEETKIERLLTILDAQPDLGLVAGLVRQPDGRAWNWTGRFRFYEDSGERRLAVDPVCSPWEEVAGIRYRRTELALNAFLARRDVLLRCPWDERLKVVGEHLDHFLTMHAHGVGVAYTPDVVFEHVQEQSNSYLRFRSRRAEFVSLLLSKWGLRRSPDHAMSPEPGVPMRSPARFAADRPDARPNLLLFGVGHSGTTVVARMLMQLGYSGGPADEQYAEHVLIRELNEAAWRTGRLDRVRARELLRQLPSPWMIKDPRFVHTIGQWLPVFEEFRPCLLWLVRDLAELKRSYIKRGEGPLVRGRTVEETFRMAEEAYRRWPWAKLRVQYEQLRDAVELFDVTRSLQHKKKAGG